MANPVWNQVLAAFESQRAHNEQENDRRRREIADQYPELDALVHQRHEMIMGAVRGAFSGGQMQTAESVMAEYNQKIAAMLKEKGYPANYLEPVCKCPLCGDTGYIYENAVQKQCECLKKAYQQALSQADGSGYESQTFAAFNPLRFPDTPLPGTDVTQRERMCAVRDKCLEYAKNIGAGSCQTLLLHGGSGLGKTFLLNCVAHEAENMGIDTLNVTAYDLLMDLKNAYFSRASESADAYFEVKLLLIDDLGMEPLIDNVTVTQIYNLLSSRLKRGLYTVITTNLSREELKQRYTERVSSRLLDPRTGIAIAFRGQDIRLTRPV